MKVETGFGEIDYSDCGGSIASSIVNAVINGKAECLSTIEAIVVAQSLARSIDKHRIKITQCKNGCTVTISNSDDYS